MGKSILVERAEELRVIAEMTQYLRDTLEQPHPVFGNLPICPFAKQARLNDQIRFFVYAFTAADLEMTSPLSSAIAQFVQSKKHQVLFMIHPDPQAMKLDRLLAFVERLDQQIQALHLTALGGHPDDSFNIQGVKTRQEPYPNVTIQSIEKLKQASDLLANTRYYENWTPDSLKMVGHPR